jgi:hypothetical protein
VHQKNHGRNIVVKYRGRKSVAEKSWQKNCSRKSAVEKLRQKTCGKKTTTTWLGSIYERYGTSCLMYVLGARAYLLRWYWMLSIVAYIRFVEGCNWYFVVGIWHMGIGILVVMCC